MFQNLSEEKKPLLNYSEHLERAELIDEETEDLMAARKKRGSKKRKGAKRGKGKRKGGVRLVNGRVSINGIK